MSVTRAAALPGIKGAYTAIQSIAIATGALPIPTEAPTEGASITQREAALTKIREAYTSIRSVAEPLGAIPKEVTTIAPPKKATETSLKNLMFGRLKPEFKKPEEPSPELPSMWKRVVGVSKTTEVAPVTSAPVISEAVSSDVLAAKIKENKEKLKAVNSQIAVGGGNPALIAAANQLRSDIAAAQTHYETTTGRKLIGGAKKHRRTHTIKRYRRKTRRHA